MPQFLAYVDQENEQTSEFFGGHAARPGIERSGRPRLSRLGVKFLHFAAGHEDHASRKVGPATPDTLQMMAPKEQVWAAGGRRPGAGEAAYAAGADPRGGPRVV